MAQVEEDLNKKYLSDTLIPAPLPLLAGEGERGDGGVKRLVTVSAER